MSEDGVALSVSHGSPYLLLCFPEEVIHSMAEHIIWQAQPVETARKHFTNWKKFTQLPQVNWWGRMWLVMPAAFLQPTPGRCLSQTSARQVPQAPVLPLEAFCLPWNKILNKQMEEKLSVSLWAAELYTDQSQCCNSVSFSASARRKAGMDDVVAADPAHQQGKLSRHTSS